MTVYTFDIECADWDTFVLGAVCGPDGPTVYHDADSLAAWYLTTGPDDVVLAHAGGGYDFLWLISAHPDREWTGMLAGSSLVSCRVAGHADCRDTMRLFPGSLDSWTGRKQPLDLPCTCGEDCGGYCAIAVDMPAPMRARLAEYCATDVQILREAYLADVARLMDEGFSVMGRDGPRLTVGSTAWNTAATMAGLDRTPISSRDYLTGRAAYYGGRTEVGAVDAPAGHAYDVHSMYPWALLHPVPMGRMGRKFGPAAAKAFSAQRPGAYRATVTVPDTSLPLLPHREATGTRKREGRLLWATGDLDAWWTGVELAAAAEHGATIRTLHEAAVWEAEDAVYAPYVEHAYGLRARAKAAGDDRWAKRLKWLLNSLSGKLAQRPVTSDVLVCPEGEGPPDDGRQWLDLGGRVWAAVRWRVPSAGRPIQAATLTSRARVKLLGRLSRHIDTWLYCDTDSTYLTSRDDTDVHPSRLGAWGSDGAITSWRALAPKLYRFSRDGDVTVRARGVPDATPEDFARLARRETVTRERGVERLRTSGGSFARRRISRTHHARRLAGTRLVLPSGRTEPLRRDADGGYRWPSTGEAWGSVR